MTRTSMIKKEDSICWLSEVSFFEASHANEWAECRVRPSEENRWEVQAVIMAKESRVGAQCGATCLHDLPAAVFTVGDEVIKQWDYNDCGEEFLGPADEQHCFLTSIGLAHARDKNQRPSCDVDMKENDGIINWRLKVCNGWAKNTQTLCGARCVSFVNSVVEDTEPTEEPVAKDAECGVGYKYSHEGYWSAAFDLQPPYGKIISSPGTDVADCAAKCNSISGCKAFSLFDEQDCWVYNKLGSVEAGLNSKACMKK